RGAGTGTTATAGRTTGTGAAKEFPFPPMEGFYIEKRPSRNSGKAVPFCKRRGWDSNPRTTCAVSGFQDRTPNRVKTNPTKKYAEINLARCPQWCRANPTPNQARESQMI